jgi:hypothetical protein
MKKLTGQSSKPELLSMINTAAGGDTQLNLLNFDKQFAACSKRQMIFFRYLSNEPIEINDVANSVLPT